MSEPAVDHPGLYQAMYRIRRFEETVLEAFSRGIFTGTTHTYLGQEANAVGVISQLSAGDIVFSNHRGHGHFLAYGGDMRALFAELMGKATGVCGGRGGSQHLHWRNFYSNGVQGGIVPVATGMALAEKIKASQAVTIVFLGDGTFGEGVIYEAFNLAALWYAPILFVVENNHIAQTTPFSQALGGGGIAQRLEAFGMPTVELDTSDILAVQAEARQLIQQIRQSSRSLGLVLNTARFGPHSKGDDTRSEAEITSLRSTRDPLEIHSHRLAIAERLSIENAVRLEVERALEAALADPQPDPFELGEATL